MSVIMQRSLIVPLLTKLIGVRRKSVQRVGNKSKLKMKLRQW